MRSSIMLKYIILATLLFASIASAYCKYISKSGEYDDSRSHNYGNVYSRKICVYGSWHIPVAKFNQYYCPYSIEVDEYTNRLCNFH